MTDYNSGYIYVMHLEGTPYYKIGKSIDPEQRRLVLMEGATLGPTTPQSIDIVHQIETNDMNHLERFMHKYYKHRHVRGEWYALTEGDLALLRTQYKLTFLHTNRFAHSKADEPTPFRERKPLQWGG